MTSQGISPCALRRSSHSWNNSLARLNAFDLWSSVLRHTAIYIYTIQLPGEFYHVRDLL